MTEPLTLELGPRDLLVVAGLPGAGKTTMLREVRDPPVLDSDQVRARLRALLPARVPYRLYRPLVHGWHRLRVVGHAAGAGGPVIVHEPSTRASTRALLAVVAVLTGRRIHLLWLDVTAEEALAGQRARGRVIRPRSFARHVRRASRFRRFLLAQGVPRGWSSARVTARGVGLRVRREGLVSVAGG
ncbi:Predicted kinase [Amycolatopsis xylanica]|uniref:Predicted kinase n=1 Tax=Amycolatopsis xylanica TaxID=589385 RepID=A0A1H2UTN5_9PSEU|nr:AAA family ATPase [Amycolatopsis xylanica]SDW59503.1 Predicted kinase [Amycolatopsis xylanica]